MSDVFLIIILLSTNWQRNCAENPHHWQVNNSQKRWVPSPVSMSACTAWSCDCLRVVIMWCNVIWSQRKCHCMSLYHCPVYLHSDRIDIPTHTFVPMMVMMNEIVVECRLGYPIRVTFRLTVDWIIEQLDQIYEAVTKIWWSNGNSRPVYFSLVSWR